MQFPESLDSPLTFPQPFCEVRTATDLDPVPRCVLSLLRASTIGQVHLAFSQHSENMGRVAGWTVTVVLRMTLGEPASNQKDQKN